MFRKIVYGIGGFIGFLLLLSCFYSVQEYQRTVVTRGGKLVAVSEPGYHLKLPFVHWTHPYSIQKHVFTYNDMEIVSRDGIAVKARPSVRYSLRSDAESVRTLHTQYSGRDYFNERTLAPIVHAIIKNTAVLHDLNSLVENRTTFEGQVRLRLSVAIEEIAPFINFDGFQLEWFEIPKDIREANEALKIAKVYAETRAIRSQADAKALELTANVVSKVPQMVMMEKWNGILPQVVQPEANVLKMVQ